jgi:formylglycine-generating enzyme required for sulfatase activity
MGSTSGGVVSGATSGSGPVSPSQDPCARVLCPTGAICLEGNCVCPPGSVTCVDPPNMQTVCLSQAMLLTDALNCGDCGMACSEGDVCQNGVCTGAGEPPSCQPGGPGLSDCGMNHEDCCVSPDVEGSTFYRTYANSGDGAINESDPASVSSFRLDKYLVTVGRFRQFAFAWSSGWRPVGGAGKHTHLNGGEGLLVESADGASTTPTYEPGWQSTDDPDVSPTVFNCTNVTWTSSAGPNESLPVNCVAWASAYAFCIWDGGFLPTDAEWEYAVAGGSLQREYPWGSTDPGTDNLFAIYGCNYPLGSSCNGVADGIIHIAPVGSAWLGVGVWDQLDLQGELSELVLDMIAPPAAMPYLDPCVDCVAVGTDQGFISRMARGGATGQGTDTSSLSPQARILVGAAATTPSVGFRCARTP